MAFLTIAGEQKIAYQQGNSLLFNVTEFVLANITGLGVEPADRIEALPDPGDIVDTRAVTRAGYVNTNQVVYSLTLDSTIGDYTFNWVGLTDADGVLVAVAHLADPITKTASAGGNEGNNLVRNFLLQYSGLAATTAINAPADTWQIDFTTRLLQIDERERLSNFDVYGRFAVFGDALKVSLISGTNYAINAGVAYVAGIRCELTVNDSIDVGALPKSIWIDASLQGDLSGVEAVWSFTAMGATLNDYTDAQGFQHFVAKVADISAGDVVTDLRKVVSPFVITKKYIIASGVYTPPTNLLYADVEIVGGGGGGGSAFGVSGNVSAGSGGGGGGYARKLYTYAEIGATADVTIGAGGLAGAAGQNFGGNGGTTLFQPNGLGSDMTAFGGQGGPFGSTSTGADSNLLGIGSPGIGVGGDENDAGQQGGWGLMFGAYSHAVSGRGGNSRFGRGGQESQQGAAGNIGIGFGSGGGGGAATAVSIAGGAGKPGLCIITEYLRY